MPAFHDNSDLMDPRSDEKHAGSTRIAENSQKSRIYKISAELFARHGYNSVGVAELCTAVNLGRGAFYYHVASKENILYEISKGYMEALNANALRILALGKPPQETIKILSADFMETMYQNQAEMTVCFRELHLLSADTQRDIRNLHQEYQDIWNKVIQDGVEEGSFRALHSAEFKALLGMYFYSFIWVNPEGRSPADELAGYFSRLVLAAIENKSA